MEDPSCEEECGVARRVDLNKGGRRTRGASLGPGDPFALPGESYAKGFRDDRGLLFAGVYLPFLIFTSVLALYTFAYHEMPAILWVTVALSVNAVLVGTWPARGRRGSRPRQSSDWWPLQFGFLALGLAILFGELTCSFMGTWVRATRLRKHTDVLPTDKPQAYADAGILHFAEGTIVDIASSAGFKSWPYTYCAAPIKLSDGGKDPIGFWAVGVNCCQARGGFTCDDAEDRKVLSGLRVDYSDQPAVAKNFDRAVRMAAADNDEVVAASPVLVVWHRDPMAPALHDWWVAAALFIVLEVVALCTCCYGQGLMLRAALYQGHDSDPMMGRLGRRIV